MQGDGWDRKRGSQGDIHHPSNEHSNIKADADGRSSDRSPIVLAYGAVAVCGSITGFFLAGRLDIASAALAALTIGCVVGWSARGNAT